ncbi:MAG: hypothetical protein L7F78_23455, partial [Syntrophales bacterium LBB04]|nr:hypothetical protein [Syntrophales bacterium LBB04]
FFYYTDLAGRVSLWMNARGKAQQSQLEQYVVPQPENMRNAWGKTFSYLQKLKREATDADVKLIVVPIPLKCEIDSEEYRRVLEASGLTPQQLDPGQPLRLISAFCKIEDIALLNPRPAMRERHAKTRCYFMIDAHWNAEGVRVSTEALARQWRDLGLPPWKNASKDEPR